MCRLKQTASMFGRANIVIVENDSVDGTSEKLREYAEFDDTLRLVQPVLNDRQWKSNDPDSTSLERVAKMSKIRNMYLDAATEFSDADYLIVIDLDLLGGWSYDGIYNSFGYDDWSAMTANGIMYITQVLRGPSGQESKEKVRRMFFDTWTFRPLGDPKFRGFATYESYHVDKSDKPIQILSNFNGLGIYDYNTINSIEYKPYALDGTVSCEHVYVNQKIVEGGGKVFINSSQITLYSPTCYTGCDTKSV
jgi:hypothetical protein